MNLLHLNFTADEHHPIKLKNPLQNIGQCYDTSSCCNQMIDYQNSLLTEDADLSNSCKIEHWWERNWQASLDYYLSSPSGQFKKLHSDSSSIQTTNPVDIALPDEIVIDQYTLSKALMERKTHRKFQETPISLKLFSTLMRELKNEIFSEIWKYYVVIFDVDEIPPGIYRYCPRANGLYLVKTGLFRGDAVKLLCGMAASFTASFLVVLSIDIQSALKNYPYNRALREIYIDSGRVAQKLLLKGMQHHVGGLPSPAMHDSQMCSFLEIDSSQIIPIYTVTMGNIAEIPLNLKVQS